MTALMQLFRYKACRRTQCHVPGVAMWPLARDSTQPDPTRSLVPQYQYQYHRAINNFFSWAALEAETTQ